MKTIGAYWQRWGIWGNLKKFIVSQFCSKLCANIHYCQEISLQFIVQLAFKHPQLHPHTHTHTRAHTHTHTHTHIHTHILNCIHVQISISWSVLGILRPFAFSAILFCHHFVGRDEEFSKTARERESGREGGRESGREGGRERRREGHKKSFSLCLLWMFAQVRTHNIKTERKLSKQQHHFMEQVPIVAAAYCNTLQHAATRCNTLQHAATRCTTPVGKTALWGRSQ